ncbi:IS91 family transposase [Thiocystis minor]|uniref:IS91 family transposase n=1 Tax=Thiocystis minor TaxID=61597 RepID=UPI0019148E08|nr:IS91 family transposase [Thiocystis minor]MBK5966741.1 IS91 family transposase [Thiocystis minor]
MILSTIIATFEADYLAQAGEAILPSQLNALHALKNCRTSASPLMRAQCEDCGHAEFIPHSCGHRACPHCQHHESQQWIERQLAKQVPATYFLVTFTVPEVLRPLVWSNQQGLYDHLIRASWETVRTFAHNEKALQGEAGAIAVLHTHSRRLDFHPHVHLVVPAAAIDPNKKLWRTKSAKRGYLFNHKALAKVFRAKLLEGIAAEGLTLPAGVPSTWVVDCKNVGRGEKALVYLGRYLYRGVIQEKDIVACENGQVTFRYHDAKRKRVAYRTLPGARFLALVLQHVLPKGFRRTRNDGFLHSNSKRLIALLQWLFGLDPKRLIAQLKPRPRLTCPCCGAAMEIVQTRIPPQPLSVPTVPPS